MKKSYLSRPKLRMGIKLHRLLWPKMMVLGKKLLSKDLVNWKLLSRKMERLLQAIPPR